MDENTNEPEEISTADKETEENTRSTDRTASVVEVRSFKFVVGGKVVAVVCKKEMEDIAGEKMDAQKAKESLITAVQQNGEKALEEEVKKEGKTKEPKEHKDKGKKGFKAKYLLPLVLAALVPLLIHSCERTPQEKPGDIPTDIPVAVQEVEEIVPFDITVFDIDNPSGILEGLVNSSGQEGLTGNLIEGDTFQGNYYDYAEQLGEESKAVAGVSQFEQWQSEIDTNMAILADPGSSQADRKKAVQDLLRLQESIQASYLANQGMAEQHAQGFKTASEAFRDANTDNEEAAIDLMLEKYMSELGLSSVNVAQLRAINDLLEDGYDLTPLTVEQELDGDYEISGEAVRKVIAEEGVDLDHAAITWKDFASEVRSGPSEDKGTKNAEDISVDRG